MQIYYVKFDKKLNKTPITTEMYTNPQPVNAAIISFQSNSLSKNTSLITETKKVTTVPISGHNINLHVGSKINTGKSCKMNTKVNNAQINPPIPKCANLSNPILFIQLFIFKHMFNNK